MTIRATDEGVPPVLVKSMEDRLSAGLSIEPERKEQLSREEILDSYGDILVQ